LIEPKAIKSSREGYRVKGTFNAGAAEYNREIILLLRVAEDCVAGEGAISVPYYRFDAEGGHPEILEVKADDPHFCREPSGGSWGRCISYLQAGKHVNAYADIRY
jgi:predicted GH43/DUF377 family glycosyl hydrolase